MKPFSFFSRFLINRISTIVLVTILMGFAMPFPVAEAGLFDKLKAKRKAFIEKRTRRKQQEEAALKKTPIPRHRSWYRDEHKDAYINQELLTATEDSGIADKKIIIDLKRQRAYLVVRNIVAIDTAISSGSRGRDTPQGSFRISEKIRTGKVSNLYHVYMPFWMRIGDTAMGMHIGDLPGYPASHGCVRLPQSVAPILFKNTPRGVPVIILKDWNEEGLEIPHNLPVKANVLASLSI